MIFQKTLAENLKSFPIISLLFDTFNQLSKPGYHFILDAQTNISILQISLETFWSKKGWQVPRLLKYLP